MDKKDLQLLELVAQNCRLSHKTMAQALNVSKDTISYRLKKLEEEKYVERYMLFVDARKLGFTRYHILLKFNGTLSDKQKLIELMSKNKYVMWINSFIGRYDLQIIVDAKDGLHLEEIREDLFKRSENKIKEYFILTHLYDLEFTSLDPLLDLKTKFQKKEDYSFANLLQERSFPVSKKYINYKITKTELHILNLLSENPKESLTTISKNLDVDRSTVKLKISNMIKAGLILNFGGVSDFAKQGYITYYLLVRLEQNIPLDILKKPFEKLQHIYYAGKMNGSYDLILYLNARNPQELKSSIELFVSELEDYLLYYDLLVNDKIYHWKQFTPGIYQSLLEELK